MKERFTGFKNLVGRLDKLMSVVLGLSPSYEEAVGGFVHGKNCSKSTPLLTTEREQIISIPDENMWKLSMHGILVTQKYVECGECKASVRYSG